MRGGHRLPVAGVVGLAVTCLTCAGCAAAPTRPAPTAASSYPPFPSTATRQFLADARTELPKYNDSQLIAAATRACTDLRSAPDWVAAARPLLADGVKGDQVGQFLHTAINAYCADQTVKAPFLG